MKILSLIKELNKRRVLENFTHEKFLEYERTRDKKNQLSK